MRMIGIGLMAFFVAWAVVLLSSYNITQRSLRQVNETLFGPQLVFEVETLSSSTLGKNVPAFFKSTSVTPIILSGLPAYQSAVFSMPIDARPISGYLQIDMTSQVLDDVKGVLRVSINNTKRGEILLYSGEAGRSLQIPLLSEELVKERLVVSFSLLGSQETNSCSSNDGIEAIAEIEATSGLYLKLDRAIQTPRDRVLSQGRMIPIQWDNNLSQGQKTSLIDIGVSFLRNGERITFETGEVIEALSIEELTQLSKTLPKAKADVLQWPHYVAQQGTNFGLRRFYKSTNWRIKYKPRLFVGNQLPNILDLNLALSRLQNQASWTVSVTLNGSLIHVETLEPEMQAYRKKIELKAEWQSANNLIEVSVYSSENHIGICNNGPILLAQMEQNTALLSGTERLDNNFFELQNAVKDVQRIGISGGENITHHQAKLLARMIATVVPKGVKIDMAGDASQLQFLGRDQFRVSDNLYDKHYKQWMLSFNDADEISISSIMKTPNDLPRDNISPNALLIKIPELGVEG